MPDMTLFKRYYLYAVMAVISFRSPVLTHDKTNLLPERLGWRDMADKFPVALPACLTSSPIQVTGHGFSASQAIRAINCACLRR